MKLFSELICIVLLSGQCFLLQAQPIVADKIVGVVGKNYILLSDVEEQYIQLKAQKMNPMPTKCQLYEEILTQKLMVNQAEVDSIEVQEEEVNMELDQRVNYFISQIGTEEKLVEYFGKSILEIKEDMHDAIREQILMQRMRNEIISGASITPNEVKSYYQSLPPDSIPYIDAEVEISQLVIYPSSSDEAVLLVREQLLSIRDRITKGEKFMSLAVLYSEDPGSSPQGGDIGWSSKAELDPAYSKAAFALKQGQVSKIVKSSFGYHIIQLIERTEDRVHTRHIMMKPKITYEEKEKAKFRIDSILQLVRIDSLTFDKAAMSFSQDEATRMNGGIKVNQATGNTRFKLDQFETSEYYIIRDLKIGEISEPYESKDEKGNLVYKATRLMSKTEPHRANIKQDYELLKNMALQKKEIEIVNEWMENKIKNTYVKIFEPYLDCPYQIKSWTAN